MADSQATRPTQLIRRLAQLYPNYGQADLLRMALLLALHHPQETEWESDNELYERCHDLSLQLNAAGDQHAAVTDELDSLAATAPCDFSPTHVFTLVRALKVQSQVLNLYLGPLGTPG